MTEGEHTPGEWFRDGTTVYALNDQGTNRMLISCGGGYVYQPHDRTSLSHERTPSNEVEANARLIAAAPDLLDGCNALLGLLTLIAGRGDVSPALREVLATNHRVTEARAAIAKATGVS